MARFRQTTYYEHAPDSPNEAWGAGGGSRMTREMDVFNGTYAGRLNAAQDFIGYAQVATSGGVKYITRVTPMPYPSLPIDANPGANSVFYVSGISRTAPLGVPGGIDPASFPVGTAGANYDRARMTVEFTTLPFQVKEDAQVIATGGPLVGLPDEGFALASGWQNTRYITRQIQPFVRLLKLPYGLMKQAATGKLLKVGIPFREGGANITYTWYRVPVAGVNFTTIGGALQTINNATFDIAPANTLLFDSFATREYQGAFGERIMDVTMHMIYLPHTAMNNPGKGTQRGWNWYLDVAGGILDYYEVQSTGGTSPFLSSDFTLLFHP